MSKNRLVRLAAFLFVLIHPFSLAGWIESLPDQTILHIEVFNLPDPTDPSPYWQAEAAGVQAFVDQFPKRFKNLYQTKYEQNTETYGNYNWEKVSVQVHKASGIYIEGVETDFLQIAGGLAPDILYMNFRKSETYIQQGFLYPLDRYMETLSAEEKAFRIHPKIEPVIYRKGKNATQKNYWCLPYGGALGKVLIYRKDLFLKHHLSFPNEQWTWDDMLHAAKKITQPSEGVFGFYATRGKHESYHWMSFLWSAGGEAMIFDEQSQRWVCTFDSREAAKALDFYTQLTTEKWIDEKGVVRRGYSSKDAGNAYLKWQRGEIGMSFTYVDEKLLSRINPETTGMAPVPLGPGGERGAELNSRMFGLFSGIKEPAIRDAAWEYMRFYDSKEAMEIKTRIMVEGGLGPFLNPKYLEMFGYDELIRLSPPGWASTFEEAIRTGKPEPYGGNSNLAYDMMTLPILEAEQRALDDALPTDNEKRLDELQAILRKANDKANIEMMGILPKETLRLRRWTAMGVLLLLFVGFYIAFKRILQTFAHSQHLSVSNHREQRHRIRWAWMLLLPSLVTILTWQYVPLFRGSIMAFQEYRLLENSVWVGVDNFAEILFDGIWWRSVWNAIRYSTLIMTLTFIPPIILAVVLQEIPKGSLLFRILYYLPAVVTGIITMLLWKQFYEPTERGVLNQLVMNIPAIGFIIFAVAIFCIFFAFSKRLWVHEAKGKALFIGVAGFGAAYTSAKLAFPLIALEPTFPFLTGFFNKLTSPVLWLSDQETAMLACVLPMIWAGLGPGCLIYLAALKGIAEEYYEAADIDGASFIDKLLFIVFPTIKMLVLINFIGAFISSWYFATGNILVMTGGASNTEVAGLYIWYKAFTHLRFGPATAAAWLLGFMLIGFTLHQLRLLNRVEFRAPTKG